MLVDGPVLHAGHFDKFIRSAVLTALAQQQDEHPRLPHELLLDTSILLKKLMKVPEDPISTAMNFGPYIALHTAVYLRGRLLKRKDVRSWFGDSEHDSNAFNNIIDQYLRLGGIGKVNPRDTVSTRTYSYAAMRRELWSQMSRVECASYDPRCVHWLNNDMLQNLQKHAQVEIHRNVTLAIGEYLSPELAEFIYEATLEAEEIPLDWRIHEPPLKTRRDAPKYHWHLSSAYSCPVTARSDEGIANCIARPKPVGSYKAERLNFPEDFCE